MKKIVSKKRLIGALIIIVLIAVAIVSNPDMQSLLMGRDSIKVSFQSGVEHTAMPYANKMLLVSAEGIRAVDEKGQNAWNVVYAMTSPQVLVKDEFIMVADVNGTQINVYEKDKLLWNVKTEKEILTSKINDKGYVAVATDELGYKGVVNVFDSNGKEVFKWHSGEGYIGDIDIAHDGTLAVAQLMTDRESVYTRIMFVDIKGKKDARCIGEIEGMTMRVCFNENDDLIAIADCGLFCYDDDGELRYSNDFGGRIPTTCNIENEDNMVFVFEGGLNNSVLESYSEKGKLRGKHEADGKIKTLDVNGEYILYSTIGSVKRISPKGELKSEMPVKGDVKGMQMFSDRNSFISLGGSSAEILKIK
ncbi:MAG: hypothetical protein IJN96_02915 [Clostridia bacterium]|nr:hypothetical protein [Clostridia bacterium]